MQYPVDIDIVVAAFFGVISLAAERIISWSGVAKVAALRAIKAVVLEAITIAFAQVSHVAWDVNAILVTGHWAVRFSLQSEEHQTESNA